MRVDRIVEQYKSVLNNEDKEKVYTAIMNDYSAADISAADFAVLLESTWEIPYTPKKAGNQQIHQKEEHSRILREKIARLATNVICTEQNELKAYKYLALLLDYSGTPEALEKNEKDSAVFLHGSKEEKTKLFWDKMDPLLGLKKSLLEAKTDEELVENWEKWEPYFTQFEVLDKILEEAESIGVQVDSVLTERMKMYQKESYLSVHMLSCRAGIVSNVYYSLIDEEDLHKIKEGVLEEIAQDAPLALKDYLMDNLDIMKSTDLHIKKQLFEKIKQIGFDNPREVILGNIRGNVYEFDKAVEVLKTNKPVYVIGENRKLVGVIESFGRDGFLKPINIRKQSPLLSDYLEKSKRLMQKMLDEQKPLSKEGEKAVRLYMANMVCYERLLNEKKMGKQTLSRVIDNDEQKFQKAANMIYKDKVFEKLTEKITLEQLRDFMENHGEIELNKQYTQELKIWKQNQQDVQRIL